MPHDPKPFFRAPRRLWYVPIDGHPFNLGADRDEAFRRYHDLMARERDESDPAPGNVVVPIFDAFLDWCQKHRARRTYACAPSEVTPRRFAWNGRRVRADIAGSLAHHLHRDEWLKMSQVTNRWGGISLLHE